MVLMMKRLNELLKKIPDDSQAIRYGHIIVGATRWYYKDLT